MFAFFSGNSCYLTYNSWFLQAGPAPRGLGAECNYMLASKGAPSYYHILFSPALVEITWKFYLSAATDTVKLELELAITV